MNVIALPQSWRNRAMVITDPPFEKSWFTTSELTLAASFHLQKRRTEWLASRYAAKKLAMEIGLCVDPATFEVGSADVHRSISHSSPYAAAALDENPVGIDVQVVRAISESAAHLFLSDEETAIMQSLSIADRMIHFWSAKEAAWKQLGGAVETLKRVPLQLEAAHGTGLRFDRVETIRVGDAVIALTR